MTESQIENTARHMIRIFGLRARGEASAMCEKFKQRADAQGMDNWAKIREKIQALQLLQGAGSSE